MASKELSTDSKKAPNPPLIRALQSAVAWTKQVSVLTGSEWKYARIDQKKFDKAKFTRLADLT